MHGKDQVAAWWKRFYEKAEAPFSWQPADVEVLPSGTLALSSGPVHDARGKQIATFTSIWRLEAPGAWRDITKLIRKPTTAGPAFIGPVEEQADMP